MSGVQVRGSTAGGLRSRLEHRSPVLLLEVILLHSRGGRSDRYLHESLQPCGRGTFPRVSTERNLLVRKTTTTVAGNLLVLGFHQRAYLRSVSVH